MSKLNSCCTFPLMSHSLMFWTDWGDRAAGVYRSYMDGTNVSCIVSEGVRWPNGITADDHWLYWTEAYSDRIERADFNGGQRSVLMEGLPHPYAIAVFKVTPGRLSETIFLAHGQRNKLTKMIKRWFCK